MLWRLAVSLFACATVALLMTRFIPVEGACSDLPRADNISVEVTNAHRISYRHKAFLLKCLITVVKPLLPSHQETVVIKWMKDGVDISQLPGFSTECIDYDNQSRTMTDALLMITSITQEIEGYYVCQVRFANETYIGGTYVIITDRYEELSLTREEEFVLHCSDNEEDVLWIKDDDILRHNTYGQSSISRKIANCSDAGIYTCLQDKASVTFNISLKDQCGISKEGSDRVHFSCFSCKNVSSLKCVSTEERPHLFDLKKDDQRENIYRLTLSSTDYFVHFCNSDCYLNGRVVNVDAFCSTPRPTVSGSSEKTPIPWVVVSVIVFAAVLVVVKMLFAGMLFKKKRQFPSVHFSGHGGNVECQMTESRMAEIQDGVVEIQNRVSEIQDQLEDNAAPPPRPPPSTLPPLDPPSR